MILKKVIIIAGLTLLTSQVMAEYAQNARDSSAGLKVYSQPATVAGVRDEFEQADAGRMYDYQSRKEANFNTPSDKIGFISVPLLSVKDFEVLKRARLDNATIHVNSAFVSPEIIPELTYSARNGATLARADGYELRYLSTGDQGGVIAYTTATKVYMREIPAEALAKYVKVFYSARVLPEASSHTTFAIKSNATPENTANESPVVGW